MEQINMAEEENDELIPMDLPTEALKSAIDAIIKEKPELKKMNIVELKDNNEFQQMFKKYMADNGFSSTTSKDSEIEILKSVIPKTFAITNNKLSNEMTKDFTNKGDISLAVMNVGKKNEIRTYNSLAYEGENVSITGRYEFTAYDRAIHNAVCSLYAAGNDIVTPAMVYRAVTGITETEYVSPQSIEAVLNSLDKSRFMRLKVDFTEEAKARGFDVDKTMIDSYLLPAEAVVVKTGGHEMAAYKILKTPALYQYSQRTKQIISIPLELLDTKVATRNTEEIIPIKEYLVRRIEIMKNDDSMGNKILYETIFDEVGLKDIIKQKSLVLRNSIKAILELWKDKGYIHNFEEYKMGRSIKGIAIFFHEKQ